MKQTYVVTVTQKFPAWNDAPFAVRVAAGSKSDANEQVRRAYRDEIDGGFTCAARVATSEDLQPGIFGEDFFAPAADAAPAEPMTPEAMARLMGFELKD